MKQVKVTTTVKGRVVKCSCRACQVEVKRTHGAGPATLYDIELSLDLLRMINEQNLLRGIEARYLSRAITHLQAVLARSSK